jgi:serine/threonine-protein kinase
MASTGPVSQLLMRWDDLRSQGQTVSAEELCHAHPELLEEVRRGIQALEAMDQVLKRQAATEAGSPPTEVPHPPPDVPGYEVLSELGRGGMGVVYRARQVRLNRPVALKMVLAGPHAGAHHLARFRAEAEAVARLQHPNIIQIYEVNEERGWPFLALELVGGGSLARAVGSGQWAVKTVKPGRRP